MEALPLVAGTHCVRAGVDREIEADRGVIGAVGRAVGAECARDGLDALVVRAGLGICVLGGLEVVGLHCVGQRPGVVDEAVDLRDHVRLVVGGRRLELVRDGSGRLRSLAGDRELGLFVGGAGAVQLVRAAVELVGERDRRHTGGNVLALGENAVVLDQLDLADRCSVLVGDLEGDRPRVDLVRGGLAALIGDLDLDGLHIRRRVRRVGAVRTARDPDDGDGSRADGHQWSHPHVVFSFV